MDFALYISTGLQGNLDSSVSRFDYEDINVRNLLCLVFCRRSTTSSAGRQMTIFYAGQAHVFDNVQPNKVHLIFMLMILMKLQIYYRSM